MSNPYSGESFFSVPRTYVPVRPPRELPQRRFSAVPHPTVSYKKLHNRYVRACAEPQTEYLARQVDYVASKDFAECVWAAIDADDIEPLIRLSHLDNTLRAVPDFRDNKGRTIVHVAARIGRMKTVQFVLRTLKDRGLFFKSLTDGARLSVLHCAVLGGSLPMCEEVCLHYCRVNKIMDPKTGKVRKQIENQAWYEELFRETAAKDSPLQLAQKNGWLNIVHWLKTQMACFQQWRDKCLLELFAVTVAERKARDLILFQSAHFFEYQTICENEERDTHYLAMRHAKLNYNYRLWLEASIAPTDDDDESAENRCGASMVSEDDIARALESTKRALQMAPLYVRSRHKARDTISLAESETIDERCRIKPVFAVRDRVKDLITLHEDEQEAQRQAALEAERAARRAQLNRHRNSDVVFPYMGLELTEGVHYRTFSSAVPKQLRIVGVVPNGPAEGTDLSVGLKLRRINGVEVATLNDVRTIVEKLTAATTSAVAQGQDVVVVSVTRADESEFDVSIKPKITHFVPSQKLVRKLRENIVAAWEERSPSPPTWPIPDRPVFKVYHVEKAI
eukprot:PhM_4_TR9768/c0_g1_i2/m.46121